MTRRSFFGQATAASLMAATGCSLWRESAPRLRVGVCSDVHLLTANDKHWHGDVLFEKALRLYDSMKADAVLLCGDIADCGLVAELEYAAEIWHRVFPGGRRSDGEPIVQLFHLGDHDTGGFAHKYPWAKKCSKDPSAVNHAIVNEDIPALWRRLFGEEWSPVQVKTVKGYSFVLGHYPVNGGGGTGDIPIPGLAEALAKADKDSTKPFFYAQHRPVYGTLPEMKPGILEKSANYQALKDHPNVLAFFGHCHRNCADELNLWQGAFTAVHVPSTNYCGGRGGRENSFSVGNHPDKKRVQQMQRSDVDHTNQLLFMSVYDEKIVISRRDIWNDASMGPDWTIPLPSPDGSCTEAARRSVSLAPEFPEGAKATVSAVRGKDRAKKDVDQIVVAFPAAHAAAGRPRAYDYEVVASADGFKPFVRRVFSTRPCWADAKDTEPVLCAFGKFELPKSGEVAFTIRPCNAYGVAGKPLRIVKPVLSDNKAS